MRQKSYQKMETNKKIMQKVFMLGISKMEANTELVVHAM